MYVLDIRQDRINVSKLPGNYESAITEKHHSALQLLSSECEQFLKPHFSKYNVELDHKSQISE